MNARVVPDIVTELQNFTTMSTMRLIAQRAVQASVPSRIEMAATSHEVIGDGVFNCTGLSLPVFDASSPQERMSAQLTVATTLSALHFFTPPHIFVLLVHSAGSERQLTPIDNDYNGNLH